MPEFVLEGRDHAARAETPFTLGFIEAMFFTNGEDIPEEFGYTDLHPTALSTIRQICAEWQHDNNHLLLQVPHYDAAQAGRDLWFTANGHGVGFWDRGLGEVGDKLTEAAQTLGEIYVYLGDDNLVHIQR